jgi:hypothetical protein
MQTFRASILQGKVLGKRESGRRRISLLKTLVFINHHRAV